MWDSLIFHPYIVGGSMIYTIELEEKTMHIEKLDNILSLIFCNFFVIDPEKFSFFTSRTPKLPLILTNLCLLWIHNKNRNF